MTVTIYHNPRCSKSRAALAIIREAGIEPQVIEYLKTPLSRDGIAALLGRLGMAPDDLMRRGESVYRALGLGGEDVTDAHRLDAMAANPILIERPIVVTPKGAQVCRPPETVRDLL